jgi:AcrR family transcriptional regulator
MRLPASVRRDQLLDVTVALLAEGGTDAVTMERVAARAGVSKALVYRHFDNAEQLLMALADREMREVADRALAATEAPTFEMSLRRSLAAWFDVLAERGTTVVTLLREPALAGPLGQRREEMRDTLRRYYARQAADEFGLDMRVADNASAVLMTGLEGLIDAWVQRGVSRRELIDTYVTMAVAAFRALATNPPVIGARSPYGQPAVDQE